ncbi:MAG: GlsB/YeaQ/YmgE family stress response membrane protein [Chloroflexi bacterium]|nr:GlsB/YeaQ/YmgE family stress response membrane protein [Chloroflexota bacterium]
MLELIGWLVIGGFAGWVAGKLVRGRGNGVLVNVVLGVVGAVLGGWIASVVFGVDVSEGFNVETLAVAILGAILILAIANIAGIGREPSA